MQNINISIINISSMIDYIQIKFVHSYPDRKKICCDMYPNLSAFLSGMDQNYLLLLLFPKVVHPDQDSVHSKGPSIYPALFFKF